MNFFESLVVPFLVLNPGIGNIDDIFPIEEKETGVISSTAIPWESDETVFVKTIPPVERTENSILIYTDSAGVMETIGVTAIAPPECKENEELVKGVCELKPASFVFPLSEGSYRKTSPFGYRIHPIFGGTSLHSGTDYAAPSGTFIYSMASGIVEKVGYDGGRGHHVIINHGNGVKTLYLHQEQEYIVVSEGQKVSAGEHIGGVGNTGNSTGAHLHFEVEVNGEKIDSETYLSQFNVGFPS